MERFTSNDGRPGMNLQAAVGEINRLKAKMIAMEQEKAAEKEKEKEEEAELDNIQESQPLAQALWDAQDAALRWYMNLPKNSIASYTDFHKKFIHQFAGSKHNLPALSMCRFNEVTIQVSNPNQEMFVAAVQNGLKAGHFNESLAQKTASTMQEVMKRAECYIKGEESNAEKRSRDSREKPSSRRSPDRYHRGSSQRSSRYEDKGSGRYRQPWRSNERTYRAQEEYTELNDLKVHVLDEILSSGHRSPPREDDEKEPKRIAVNTIAGGFAGGGESKAARKRYLRRIIQETNTLAHVSSSRAPEISFSPGDGEGVFPHDDDPLEAFKAMQLAGEQLQPYNGTLVGFGGEQVEVMGHVTLLTTFGEKENAKTIKVRYLIVKTTFTSYNIIIGRPAFNTLGEVLSTLYLSMKYPLDDGRVGTVRGDQAQGRQCYELSLRLKRNQVPADQPIISRVNMISRANMVETLDLDPREEFQDRRVSPIEDLEPIQIGEAPHELTNLGTHLDEGEKEKIIEILRKNVDLFAWKPSDMPGIDESIITHNWSKHQTTARSLQCGSSEKIEREMADMCRLHRSQQSMPQGPVPATQHLQTDRWRLRLKNSKLHGRVFKRLMDRVFAHQIGKNLEVYIDDMVVKTTSKGEHHEDLKDILASVRKYNMRLNPASISSISTNTDSPTTGQPFVPVPCCIRKLNEFGPSTRHQRRGENDLHCQQNIQRSGDSVPENREVVTCSSNHRRRLRHYFQSHKIIVKTDHPIKHVLKKPDLAGRMVAWAVELSEYDITFVPTGNIKSQILADFILELSSPPEATNMQPWTLSVDGASNIRGSGAGVVLEGPDGVLIEQSLRFAFKASNNQAEYEALIAGMRLAKEMEVADLRAKSDSQLVTSQVSGEFQAKDPQLIKYLEQVRSLAKHFNTFELIYVPREQNARADLLKKPENNRTVIQETVKKPSTGDLEVWMVTRNDDWRTPIIQYLENEKLPEEKEEKIKIKKIAAHYNMVGGELYKRGFSSPMLLCVGETESRRILNEIHNRSCGSHIGGRSLAGKVTRAGFCWPTLLSDANRHVRSCDQCQRHANLHHAPREPLQSVMSPWPFYMMSPWPFYMWGVDILGPFTTSQGQAKFLLVAVDYFTKWIEAEPVATISSERFKKFFCQEKGIRNTFISVEHPQANGQAESANKVILRAIKRRLEGKDKNWFEYLLPTLWSYHTTIHSSNGETHFKMVYGVDAMIPAEVDPPSWRRATLTAEVNSEALKENLDLLDEVRETAHFREFTVK
ncbi:hypothetical protein TSUD_183540 [Trifolium subterraneum]|uniref:RNase H type-1 domain-containing protein n=1 Tax=Trifolium subterraneum TaxID=3900 RepID=A0A2Z6MKW0_TRISU|nr:hypothetical protein TSUD_183540 [Trifolium subterraneum]